MQFSIPKLRSIIALSLLFILVACSPINKQTMGVNAFVNDPAFGTIEQQFAEVQTTLGLTHVRVLFNWNDQVQPTPSSSPNFSFYDSIAQSIPAGMDALVIINGLPSWMSDSANWINGDPRQTFIQLWFKPVVTRYSAYSRISSWEVWNEPNDNGNPQNATLGINMGTTNGAANYAAMLSSAFNIAKAINPNILVVSAATTSINQNYPNTLNYNKQMYAAGAAGYCDIWGVHYYGKEYDHIYLPDGIQSFINGLGKTIWLTESGAQGVTAQLSYVNQTWSILESAFDKLARLYYYQFTEATPPDSTYGLRNLGPGQEYSDLYNYLAD
jgi:hypothetical protein